MIKEERWWVIEDNGPRRGPFLGRAAAEVWLEVLEGETRIIHEVRHVTLWETELDRGVGEKPPAMPEGDDPRAGNLYSLSKMDTLDKLKVAIIVLSVMWLGLFVWVLWLVMGSSLG